MSTNIITYLRLIQHPLSLLCIKNFKPALSHKVSDSIAQSHLSAIGRKRCASLLITLVSLALIETL